MNIEIVFYICNCYKYYLFYRGNHYAKYTIDKKNSEV